jgi:hypothetical protein
MNKKKFYISDVPSVCNALNLITDGYDKDIKRLFKMNRQSALSMALLTGSVWMLTAIVKNNRAKIKSLEEEIKTLKEGTFMTEGE